MFSQSILLSKFCQLFFLEKFNISELTSSTKLFLQKQLFNEIIFLCVKWKYILTCVIQKRPHLIMKCLKKNQLSRFKIVVSNFFFSMACSCSKNGLEILAFPSSVGWYSRVNVTYILPLKLV
jgi:hypothetical protein